jgi:hypothetical protein
MALSRILQETVLRCRPSQNFGFVVTRGHGDPNRHGWVRSLRLPATMRIAWTSLRLTRRPTTRAHAVDRGGTFTLAVLSGRGRHGGQPHDGRHPQVFAPPGPEFADDSANATAMPPDAP